MNQVSKFYLTSFLKNQTYFTPVFVLFLQFYHLDFQQIFWILTIGSIVAFVIEIPTGVIADLYGKRRSIIVSKLLIFLSYLVFGFSTTFWWFVLAQVVYELGQAFRSGTETAYTFEYLEQNGRTPSYTEVKGKQKFWARTGEAAATALGGWIAARLGFNWVFLLAAIPALVNLLLAFTWEKIREHEGKVGLRTSVRHAWRAAGSLISGKPVLRITINIMLFTAALAAANTFIQPYMVDAGIDVEAFGLVYAAALIITALAVRYSFLVEQRYGRCRIMNALTLLAAVPAAIIGAGYVSYLGVGLFFAIVIVENIRSPVANNMFHRRI
ncbi:MAG: MFS transporter, partial [Nanoarchaeota archaeon]